MQEDDPGAAVEALEDDIAAILGDRGTHPRVDQVFDLRDNLGVALAIVGVVALLGAAFEKRQAAGEMLHDRTVDGGLDEFPIAITLSHGNEIGTEEDARDFRDLEKRQDRKSTRLNSSHMSISYAVFCSK